MFAFVVFKFFRTKQIGWAERPQNDTFCVGWDVKHYLNQIISFFVAHL